ncbi:MAG: 5'-nucleotidase C-terminal domain-containing protein, partial [Clostridiales bacterium]|nr:5'-nucleotidase C-terminal domain-containing protein [Clostridiales bacterium]
VAFDSEDDLYYNHRESGLGDLIADSYMYAVEQAEGEDAEPPTLALTVSGVIRGSFTTGDITVADVFNVSSLGTGTDGLAGYPLAEIWITGKELKQGCEIDASIQGMMPSAQLHVSGITFTWNPHRMFLNRVESVQIVNPDGSLDQLEDDKLYKVVTGLYCAQMLGAVKDQSFGLLSITPKYADGTEITDFDDCIIYDENGQELKEWYALASYIESFGEDGIPDTYAQELCTTRKVEDDSWNPVALLKGMNKITVAVIVIVAVIIVVIVLIIRRIVRRRKKKRAMRADK